MLYNSTRDNAVKVTSAEAITRGISADGGLFVPESFPQLSKDCIAALCKKDYIGRAKEILSLYLTDYTEEEIDYCVNGAYQKGKFGSEDVAHLVKTDETTGILELWHGPTCAFKDMALQLLPYLLTTAVKKTCKGEEIVILVATSGDTGKAALEGFKDVEGTKIMVFYPEEGVSSMQKRQMCTQEGENVCVCAIKGNFDDAQTGVKKIFTDPRIGGILAQNGMKFSSANSINWGRLVPQVVYYVSAYCDMVTSGTIKLGDRINIVVPTGNFGNILAAYYAYKMGLPVNRLICASNKNNVLTDFIATGEYDRNRDFYTTISPSMDILISSNLERLIYDLSGGDSDYVRDIMSKLNTDGCYKVTGDIFNKLSALFAGGCCDDVQTKLTIREMFDGGYLCDTHTAVGIKVYKDYLAQTGDKTPTVIASTASPYKFCDSVLDALGKNNPEMGEFDKVDELFRVSGLPIPQALESLKAKPIRFSKSCTGEEMEKAVLSGFLEIGG
ncbi:MAG: threonine synthase [Clostridia bacterium]|nr:threonine synthase [Clostridia bacterium]